MSVPGEPVRVPATVPALVVGADDAEALALQERHAAEHLLAQERVRPHQPGLAVVQGPRLLEDAVGDPDLADVVEQEAVLGARVVDEVGAHRPRQLERVALHPLRVRARARVLGLERARERRDGLLVGVLEQDALAALDLEQVPEVAGVEEELLPVLGLALGAGRAAARRRARP